MYVNRFYQESGTIFDEFPWHRTPESEDSKVGIRIAEDSHSPGGAARGNCASCTPKLLISSRDFLMSLTPCSKMQQPKAKCHQSSR
jgi:hypothetical protein